MRNPTRNEIADAKSYIRRRLSAEVSMEHYLDRQLLKAANEIISIAYNRNIPPSMFSFQYDPVLSYEVDRIIRKLLSDLEEFNYRMATATDKEDSDTLLLYINREISGFTYHERMVVYTSRFQSEIQNFIGAGLLLGWGMDKVLKSYRESYKTPYANTIMSDIKHKGMSSYNRLLVLTRHTIADAWMHADMEYSRRMGAIGFIPYRGSNYPCDTCSDHAGRFHDFSEPYPPFHPRCVCYAVPIYNQ